MRVVLGNCVVYVDTGHNDRGVRHLLLPFIPARRWSVLQRTADFAQRDLANRADLDGMRIHLLKNNPSSGL